MTFQLTDYQINNAHKGLEILKRYGIVYYCCEVRTRKTGAVLECARLFGARKVLFLTTKRAMSSILGDYKSINPGYEITVINDASAFTLNEAKPVGRNGKKLLRGYEFPLKVDDDYDLLVYDESHRCLLGNTQIDGKMIKDIEAGSFQRSFNFATGAFESKKVLNVFKNPLAENLIKIKCNGKELICTESHKIFTRRGWVEARNILPDDELQVV